MNVCLYVLLLPHALESSTDPWLARQDPPLQKYVSKITSTNQISCLNDHADVTRNSIRTTSGDGDLSLVTSGSGSTNQRSPYIVTFMSI